MIPGLDSDPESDFQTLGNSESGLGSSKKWNRYTSTAAAEPAPVFGEGQCRRLPPRGPGSLRPDVAVSPLLQVALRGDHGGLDEVVPLPE